ncbi:MAG TPA: glycosyltransferase family 2 protein [Burkholderiaceae bacterium]|nr:glycosyltransferase family 2 protein [Burkholderiaceae bacterium]
MNAPLVSIVLPTYKRAHLLAGAIDSVLAQTWRNWELIVVDDNSPDNTREVVAGFADPRIRYFRNDPNLKLPRALNRGFAEARGDYLTWTSDDNLYMPHALERMLERLSAGDCDLVYADYYLFSEQDAQGLPSDPQLDRLPDTVQLERGNHIGACFLYTRRLYESVGDYDPDLFLVEDYDYFIRAARRFQLAHIGEPLYHFRRDDATLYLSRFAEVKASDLLVRYKNELLDERGVVDQMIALLLRHAERPRDPLLHWTAKLAAASGSWRIGQWQQRLAEMRLKRRLGERVQAVLQRYRSRDASFGTARDALRTLMGEVAEVKYVRP